MSDQTPDVSVIVPVYNVYPYLEQCLASLADEPTQKLEIICINDGSTDDSLSVMQEFAARDARFLVIDKPNEGYGASMNRGIAASRGRYIAVVEPDDYLCGPLHARLFELASEYNWPDIVKSAFWLIDEESSSKESSGKEAASDTVHVEQNHCGFWKRIKPKSQPFCITEAPLLMRYHPSIWSAIYRRDFITANNICFKEVPGAGWVDNPFMVQTYLLAKSIAYTNEAFYCYRNENANSSSASIGDYHVPIDRWHEMTDIFNSVGVHDETLLGMHYYRAFSYLDSIRQARNFEESGWHKAAKSVVERMDRKVLARSAYVSPTNRRLVEQLTGCAIEHASNAPYLRMLASEAIWKIRQNGIRYLLRRMLK